MLDPSEYETVKGESPVVIFKTRFAGDPRHIVSPFIAPWGEGLENSFKTFEDIRQFTELMFGPSPVSIRYRYIFCWPEIGIFKTRCKLFDAARSFHVCPLSELICHMKPGLE
jgi:hypothetical protein